jgi:hypothetical protein
VPRVRAAGSRGSSSFARLIPSRLAAAAAALLLTWALTRPAAVHPVNAGPRVADEVELVRAAAASGHAVYWTGPKADARTELTLRSDGSVYVRYLPRGVDAGAQGALPTVATYEVAGAYAATLRLAARRGATRRTLPNGAVAVVPSAAARDVYVAFPGGTEQVEVFSPSAGAALAAAARVRRVGGP